MVEKILEKLTKFRNSQYPILSVYLGAPQKKSAPSFMMTSIFHSQVHQYLGEQEKKTFESDIKRIDEYLKNVYDSRANRSIVFFSAGKNLWEVFEFEFCLPPLCVVSHSPYTKPIKDAQNDYRRYLVLLADHKKARLFNVHLGRIEEHVDILNEDVPQRVKSGDDTWDQQNKIQRHIEDHLHRHLKLISKKADEFAKSYPVSFVIVGGHPETIPKIKKHLKYPLNKIVLGQFVTELNIPLNEVFLHSKKIAQRINQK